MSYFFVKVKLPVEQVAKGNLLWMPTLITFESDGALKGIGVFTTWLKADEFRTKLMESGLSFEPEVIHLGDGVKVDEEKDGTIVYSGMPLTEFIEGVTNATRRISTTYLELPVYVDPPDPYCKMVMNQYGNLQRFLRRAMKEELDAMCEHLSYEYYNGFTIILHKRKIDGYFGCSAFRGKFTGAEAMNTAIEDARGTTIEKFAISTEFVPLEETAEMHARAAINDLVGPEEKRPSIIV